MLQGEWLWARNDQQHQKHLMGLYNDGQYYVGGLPLSYHHFHKQKSPKKCNDLRNAIPTYSCSKKAPQHSHSMNDPFGSLGPQLRPPYQKFLDLPLCECVPVCLCVCKDVNGRRSNEWSWYLAAEVVLRFHVSTCRAADTTTDKQLTMKLVLWSSLKLLQNMIIKIHTHKFNYNKKV